MIISQCKKGYSNSQISYNVGVKRTTVATIVSSFLIDGKVQSSKRGGDFSTKLSDGNKMMIRSWVDEDATITLKKLRQKLMDECNMSVSVSTINRYLNQFHYSLKTLTIVPQRRNCESTLDQRLFYAQKFNAKLLETEGKTFVFIDEVGFSVSSRTRFGRSLTGSSACISVPSVRSRNISVIASMSKDKMVMYKINHKPVNGEDFKGFLIELSSFCRSNGVEDPCFILDNARIHHYRGLEDIIHSLQLSLLYLPPYSPFLNPIENVFSKWKNTVVRSEAKCESDLLKLIEEGFNSISCDDCSGYYGKMLRYIAKCLAREVISE